MARPRTSAFALCALGLVAVGCGPQVEQRTVAARSPSPATPAATSTTTATATATATVTGSVAAPPAARPDDPVLAIPSIGVRGLRVVPYRGEPDDALGTRIQNTGVAATPRGPRGGVAPGEVGNLIVTGHRLSAGGPLRRLPELRPGDRVSVTVGRTEYVYEVTGTLVVSFRDERSKVLQRLPVPGRPGVAATRPSITLSTCRTLEDRAEGNAWTDAFGNPEHRIDKVGVLVARRPAR